MNNKPVAWINKKGDFVPFKESDIDIPLYTHPAKTLTDEEIEELALKHLETVGPHVIGIYDFVRAILQKANNG